MNARVITGLARIEGSRIIPVDTTAPAPKTSLENAGGFAAEALPHDMAQLRDPNGHPCGLFAHKRLAPATLAFLAR